jgi:hypothetical protein
MSGARHRRKGDRIEREIVQRHVELGIKSERYPLSGASRFRGSGHDIDLYLFGADEAPAIAEVKARQSRRRLCHPREMARRIRRPLPSPQQRRSIDRPAVARLGTADQTGAPMTSRNRLPNRRLAETFELECAGLRYTATVGRFADGNVAELFLNNHKSNSASDANARDAAIVCSLALQNGVPLETIRHALLRDSQGRPSTPLGIALDAIAGVAP